MNSRTRPLAVLAGSHEVLALPEADPRLLDEVEQARAARFRQEQTRRDFVAAHLLVRLCAARLLGVSADRIAFAQYCPECRQSGHGRPMLADRPEVHLSMSHARGVVAAAAGFVPVGIDVEARRATGGEEVEQRVLTPAERRLVAAHPDPSYAFLRQWVRKEAMIKIGRTDLDSLGRLDLSGVPLDDSAAHRFEDLYVQDRTDLPRDALVSLVSTVPGRLGTAAVPFSDLADPAVQPG